MDENSEETLLQNLADIESRCDADPSEKNYERLAEAHCRLVVDFDDNDDPESAAPHLDAIRRLHERFPANPRILQSYARALVHHHDAWLTAAESDPARAAVPYQTLAALAEKHPEFDLSEKISDAYFNQIYYYIKTGELRAAATIRTRLNELHARHADSPHITCRLAQACLTLVQYYADTGQLPLAVETNDAIESFIEKHIPALHPEAQNTLRRMQIHGLTSLIETAAERSNTGNSPVASDPDAIAVAETHYSKLRALCAPIADAYHRAAEKFGDASIALYNHYILANAAAAAAEKYLDIERLYNRYPDVCASYYSRAIYGRITAAAGEQRFDDAEKYLAAFEEFAAAREQQLAEQGSSLAVPESTRSLATVSSALANAYGDADRMADAERHSQKIAAIIGRTFPPDSASLSPEQFALLGARSTTLFNLALDYSRRSDFQSAIARHTDLVDLADRFPDFPAVAEDLVSATDHIAAALAKNGKLPLVEKLLACRNSAALVHNPSLSKTLYNLIVIATDSKDFPAAERFYIALHEIALQHPANTAVALRFAKAAYNMHYDYSEAGNFAFAETKYRDLQTLAGLNADNPGLENGNPIGLEIALRQANAARNYAVDLKNKKQLQRIPALYEDVRVLAARWPVSNPAAKPIHEVLNNLAQLK